MNVTPAWGRSDAPRTRGAVLFFANVPFNTVWQRAHHIAAGLSEWDDVVYVDPNRSFLKVLRPGFRTSPAAAPPRLRVYTPPPGLPFARRYGLVNKLNYRLVAGRLKAFLQAHHLKPSVLVTTFPDQGDIADRFPGVPLVYDLMDEPGLFLRPAQRPRYDRLHHAMLARADLLVTSARVLADRYGRFARRCVWISNGVRAELLAQLPTAPPDPVLAQLPRPRVGYVGMISHWFDFDAVRAMAERLPGGTVVLVGPSEVTPPPLPPNVVFAGPVPHHRLAGTLAGFDAGLIPFVRSPAIDAVNPVKLYEYMAAGLPVLAADFAEIRQYRPLVSTYRDPGEAADEIARLVGPQSAGDADRRREFARGHSWQTKAAEFAAELSRHTPAAA